MSSGRVGKAIVPRCLFSGSYGWHREMEEFFARAVTGGTGVNGLNINVPCTVSLLCMQKHGYRHLKTSSLVRGQLRCIVSCSSCKTGSSADALPIWCHQAPLTGEGLMINLLQGIDKFRHFLIWWEALLSVSVRNISLPLLYLISRLYLWKRSSICWRCWGAEIRALRTMATKGFNHDHISAIDVGIKSFAREVDSQ